MKKVRNAPDMREWQIMSMKLRELTQKRRNYALDIADRETLDIKTICIRIITREKAKYFTDMKGNIGRIKSLDKADALCRIVAWRLCEMKTLKRPNHLSPSAAEEDVLM